MITHWLFYFAPRVTGVSSSGLNFMVLNRCCILLKSLMFSNCRSDSFKLVVGFKTFSVAVL